MPLPEEYRRQTFLLIGGVIMGAFGVLIITYNYYLLAPHLSAVFWAFIVTLILRKVKHVVLDAIAYIAGINFKLKLLLLTIVWSHYLWLISSCVMQWDEVTIPQRFVSVLVCIAVGVVLLSPLILSRQTLATVITIAITVIFSSGVGFVVAQICFRESIAATNLLRNFVEQNKAALIDNLRRQQLDFSAQVTAEQAQRNFTLNETAAAHAPNMVKIPQQQPSADSSHSSAAAPQQPPADAFSTAAPTTSSDTSHAQHVDTHKSRPFSDESMHMWRVTYDYCKMVVGVSTPLMKSGLINRIRSFFPHNFGKNDTELTDVQRIQNMQKEYCRQQVQYMQENLSLFMLRVANMLTSNISMLGNGIQTFFSTFLELINSLTELAFSTVIFFLFMFYMLTYDEYLSEELGKLSPFSEEESLNIMSSIDKNIVKTIAYSLLLAFCRFLITFVSFSYAQFEVVWIFSFLSGFLSLIPVLSSWVIYFPASIFALARDGFWSSSWILILVLHTGLAMLIDSYLYNRQFKDSNPNLLGVSIILGMYSFGWPGLIKGPLIVSLTIVLIDLYKTYTTMEDKKESPQEDDDDTASQGSANEDETASNVRPQNKSSANVLMSPRSTRLQPSRIKRNAAVRRQDSVIAEIWKQLPHAFELFAGGPGTRRSTRQRTPPSSIDVTPATSPLPGEGVIQPGQFDQVVEAGKAAQRARLSIPVPSTVPQNAADQSSDAAL